MRFFLVWFVFLITISPLSSYAKRPVLELNVQENLEVLKKPRSGAKVISQLGKGDKVVISRKIYGKYRKVRVIYNGKKRGGYILAAKIIRSYIEERGRKGLREKRIYVGNYGAGISSTFSYVTQAEREVTASGDTIYQISKFESSTMFVQVHVDIPISNSSSYRLYLNFRETDFTGTSKVKGINANPGKAALSQTFFGLGGQYKMYLRPLGLFWYGLGGELAFGSDVELRLNNIIVETDKEDLPFFAILTGAIGWDVAVTQNFYIIPEIPVLQILSF